MNGNLNAGDLCTRIVTIADRGMGVVQAAQLMRERHVGCLVVVDETSQGRLVVGMLTDRDIVTSIVAKAIDTDVLVVEDAMTTDVATAGESDSMADLLATMRRKGLRRLPVTTPQGVLIGLVTLDDLLVVMAEQLQAMAAVVDNEQRRERERRG